MFVYIHILLCEKAAIPTKGQLISKGLFGILNSSKNRRKKFSLTKAELQKVGIFFRTQFPSQGIFINNKIEGTPILKLAMVKR